MGPNINGNILGRNESGGGEYTDHYKNRVGYQ